jgi:hypothetical protein
VWTDAGLTLAFTCVMKIKRFRPPDQTRAGESESLKPPCGRGEHGEKRPESQTLAWQKDKQRGQALRVRSLRD